MNLKDIKKIYFLGIGGIGMSALARFFNMQACEVLGYDKTPTALTIALEKEGIDVHYDDFPDLILNDIDLVVYTPAIPNDLNEYQKVLSLKLPIKKRAEVLGIITADIPTIALAGTHGKTTMTSIVAHVLHSAGKNVTAFIGGIAKNFNSNFVLSPKPDYIVVEADEFDRSFLKLFPDIAVVSSMDADHLDVYGEKDQMAKSFNLFVNQIKNGGVLISKSGLNLHTNHKHLTYSSNEGDLCLSGMKVENGKFVYSVQSKGKVLGEIKFGLPGLHNVENSLAAIAVALELGLSFSEIKRGLETYLGVHRRFDIQLNTKDVVFIDDYAHHPEELKACIHAVKELYPGKKILGIFQPHLYSRTRDFAEEFALSLESLDVIVLLDIYPARELPVPGVDSNMLLNLINSENKYLFSKTELLQKINEFDAYVFLTLGAGDIDRLVEPISRELSQRIV
ncbi:MAG: UDP-N-acetylmuramate--L-alanine ligase [Bacteroidales bacterium]|nr:UDP-N-acetylmuramate--L-alanine ligase [Bacteroidales bacterium]